MCLLFCPPFQDLACLFFHSSLSVFSVFVLLSRLVDRVVNGMVNGGLNGMVNVVVYGWSRGWLRRCLRGWLRGMLNEWSRVAQRGGQLVEGRKMFKGLNPVNKAIRLLGRCKQSKNWRVAPIFC